MDGLRYKDSLAYSTIERIASKSELEKRKRKVLEGIRYHREKGNTTQSDMFLSQYEHIESRLKITS